MTFKADENFSAFSSSVALPSLARDSKVVSTLSILPNWSNTTFAAQFCAVLGTGTDNIAVTVPEPTWTLWEVPDCFYDFAGGSISITMSNVVFKGNATYPDPLLRLGKSAASCRNFVLFRFAAVDPSGVLSLVDWTSFFSATPLLNFVSMTSAIWAPGATLPAQLPVAITSFVLPNCSLTGSIPATLFSSYASSTYVTWYFDFSNNSLIGSIPAGLFPQAPFGAIANELTFMVTNNLLNDTIPPSWLPSSFQALNTLYLDLRSNDFSGTLTDVLLPNAFLQGSLKRVNLLFGNNSFTGTIPTWLSGKCSQCTIFIFSAENNALEGTIPTDFFSSLGLTTSPSLSLILSGNKRITGDIPSGLLNLDQTTPTALSPSSINVAINRAALNGTIASDFFANMNWTLTTTAGFFFSDNQLTGDLPTNILNTSPTGVLGSLKFDVSNNLKMTGSMPSTFLSSLDSPVPSSHVYGTVAAFSLSNTSLTGALEWPDLRNRIQAISVTLLASDADFTTLSFAVGGHYLATLDVSRNRRLRGTLPSSIFNSSTSQLSALIADSTLLSGPLPNFGSLSPILVQLSVVNTTIDFCSGTRSSWSNSSAVSLCALNGTNAYSCQSYYQAPKCTFSDPGCPAATRPSEDFVCLNGQWVYVGNVNVPVFTIPSGASTTVVLGNISSSDVVINGLGSNIVIQGCATNLSAITVVLTAEDLKHLTTSKTVQQLLSIAQNANCSDLSNVQVGINIHGSSCKKVKAEKTFSGGTLSATFSIDNSGCRTWWIVLTAVLVSVAVITIIVLVLLTIFVKSFRERVRPYSRRQAAVA